MVRRKQQKIERKLSDDKPQNTRRSFSLFIGILKRQKMLVIIAILACFLGSILYTAIPWFMGEAIDIISGFIKGEGLGEEVSWRFMFSLIGKPVVLLIIASLLSYICSYIAERVMADISEESTLYLRKRISDKLTKLPLNYYDNTKVGTLLSTCSTDIDKISEILVIGFNQFMLAFFDVIFGIAIMLYINVKLTLIVFIVIIISMIFTTIISRKSQTTFNKNLSSLAKFNGVIEEMYSGTMIIKAFNAQEKSKRLVEEVNEKQYETHLKAQFMNYVIYPVIRFINQMAFIISAIIGATLVIASKITLGVVQAYLQYVSQISEPVTQFAFVINSFQASLASIERVYNILDREEETKNIENPKYIKKPKGEISFKNVSFGYTKDKMLMKDVTIDVKPNQTVAIVGPTGAGKTTMVNLLMRFYEINSGKITFDGVSTRDMTREHIRGLFGMVLQDTWLFRGTVAENIAYGNKDATREEIIEAAKLAECDSFIHTLENGYDTIISSEDNILSQGQQQLLTIARTALANPNVLILDEATSSIDTITEIKIQEALSKLMENRTSFIIAHRLSTIRNADMIIVMNKGDIIESGSHEELLSYDSFYSKLYNS